MMHVVDQRANLLLNFEVALANGNLRRCAYLMDEGRRLKATHKDFAACAKKIKGWDFAEFDAFCEELDQEFG